MSDNKEPDFFVLFMKFALSCATYIVATGFTVYIGTKVLRLIGVTP